MRLARSRAAELFRAHGEREQVLAEPSAGVAVEKLAQGKDPAIISDQRPQIDRTAVITENLERQRCAKSDAVLVGDMLDRQSGPVEQGREPGAAIAPQMSDLAVHARIEERECW